MPLPKSPSALRKRIAELVGWPQEPLAAHVETRERRRVQGAVVEELLLDGRIPGTLIRPEGDGPFPAVLYCHAHGGRHERGRSELMAGAKSLYSPWGPQLAALGFVALSIDMPSFGERQGEGPEGALAKAHHWRGDTLYGAMLRELSGALGALAARPEVDASRLVALGLSMGASHAFWLGALDRRVSGVVQLCVMADMGPLIDSGAHDLHAPYLTVPGLLAVAEIGDVAGLVAPRPQFIAHGADDPLTPQGAREGALARVRAAYGGEGAELTSHLEPNSGHVETEGMRRAALNFLGNFVH